MTLEYACAIVILLGVLAVLFRVVHGPTLVDRVLAVNVIGTKTIVVLCLIGFIYDRPAMFLDIALAYALINFIATIAVLRYLEALARRRDEARAAASEAGDGGDLVTVLVDVLHALLLVAGTVFLLAAVVGVIRFPDFYTRLHAAGKGDTLGQALVLLGLIVSAGLSMVSVKLALIVFFVLLFNPTATHALAHGAWVSGVRPWTGQPERPFPQREGQLDGEEREALLESSARSEDAEQADG